MQHFGVVGAPLAVLVGELSNIVGITLISLREIRVSRSMIGVAK